MSQESIARMIESAETLRDKGLAIEAIRLLTPIADSEKADLKERVEAKIALSKSLLDVGRLAEAINVAEMARNLANGGVDERLSATADLTLAFMYLQCYRSNEAAILTESILPKSRSQNWPEVEANALALKAHFAELRGDYHPALAYLQQGLERAKRASNIKRQVTVLSDIGRIQGILGNYGAAFDALRESTERAVPASLLKNVLINRYREALLSIAIGETDLAKRELEVIEEEAGKHSLVDPRFSALHQLGLYHLRLRDYEKALDYLKKAKRVAADAGLKRHSIYSTLDLSKLYREVGESQAAIKELSEVWQAMQPLHARQFEAIPQFLKELAALLPTLAGDQLREQSDKAEQVARSSGIYDDFASKRSLQDAFLADLPAVVDKAFAVAKTPRSYKAMTTPSKGKKRPTRFKYQVALSFAGEDRGDAEKIARLMEAKGIKVFYDKLEEANLWGKDLYEHLDRVYRIEARYCLMFLSEHYARKQWTNHERQSAQARAFEENEEYILPVRLDDTAIPGVRPTVGYLDLRIVSHDVVVQRVEEKLNRYVKGKRKEMT